MASGVAALQGLSVVPPNMEQSHLLLFALAKIVDATPLKICESAVRRAAGAIVPWAHAEEDAASLLPLQITYCDSYTD